MSTAPIVLVDGSSYLYRAYHALPPLTNSHGQPTGAIKGVISMLRSLQKSYPDSLIAVVFDARGKTFRDEIYPEYKAHRPPMPDDLQLQVEPIHRIIRALGLPLLIVEGVEADDVIGTLAAEARATGIPVVVSTGDKDLAQLVNEQVTLINTMNNSTLTPDGVVEKFGIPPDRIVDLLALTGDKVDNIPGVPGIGEKTAVALLMGIGGLDEIYANLEQVRNLPLRGARTLPEKLVSERSNAFLSRELATIRCNIPLPFHLSGLTRAPQDNTTLADAFRELEFKGWLAELEAEAPDSSTMASTPAGQIDTSRYETILEPERFLFWLERLQGAGIFAFDTETTSLDYMEAELVGFSVAITPGEAAYVPLGHDYIGAPKQLDREWALTTIKPLLESDCIKKIGQNLKYDTHVLRNHGIALRGIAFDTMLESYVLDSTATRHNMDDLSLKYLNHQTIHFEDIAGKGRNQLTFNQIPIDLAARYAAEDADVALRLHQTLWPHFADKPGLQSVLEEIEIPLIPVLARMEHHGALIDARLLQQQGSELDAACKSLQQEAFRAAGEEFNLASPMQLQAILYEKLQIPVLKKTPKGQPSTAEAVLQELAEEHELPKIIMQHRSLSKLKSTYTDALPAQICRKTGRIHTSYHQAVAATGRLSSSAPNLQNIPIRTAEGRKIRQAFIAPPGKKIVAADYSQIELRIMAHLSHDQGLLAAFSEGRDVHRATAAEVFNVAIDQVSTDQRRSAKAINFGLIYGMSAFGLARQLNIGRHEAQQYMDRYFDKYPGVKTYMDKIRAEAARLGYVETLFGRRLYLPDIKARNVMLRQAAERTAINAPMQGTAADIIKHAMIAVDEWLNTSQTDAAMIMQVHDELVFEVASAEVDLVAGKVREKMQSTVVLDVPLIVDIGVGNNWDEAH